MPTLSKDFKSSTNRKRRAPLDAKQRRKTRLATILSQGLPPFPDTVLELSSVLDKPSVDLKRAGGLIRTDPSLSAQVLRLCNSPLFGLRYRVVNVQQASVLLGVERLRSIAFTCSLVEYAGVGLPADQVKVFWQHCFLTALLSERLATKIHYLEQEHAYIAGLLHDIGQIPQWMLAVEESLIYKVSPPPSWMDNPSIEREHFGMDHCEIGSTMGITWNFMPSLIDVLGYHHKPNDSLHDPHLVKIVSTIEQFLCAKANVVLPASPHAEGDGNQDPPFDAAQESIAEFLEMEYEKLLPKVQLGLESMINSLP